MLRALLFGLVVATAVATTPWPGSPALPADIQGTLGSNISGLSASGPDQLWAVRDAPSELLKLELIDGQWGPADGWSQGSQLRYADGTGSPDAEAVTIGPDLGSVYVGAERDNDDSAVSRNSILEYRTASAGTLAAEAQWELDVVLPEVRSNRGVEGLAWLSPQTVASANLLEGAALPAGYDESNGLFVVGLEVDGELRLLALGHDGSVTLVATVPTDLPAVMGLAWSSSRQQLWALCDASCGSQLSILRLETNGFAEPELVGLPSAIETLDVEGLALRPGCDAAGTEVLWSDEDASNGTVLHAATVGCAAGSVSPTVNTSEPTESVAAAASAAVLGDKPDRGISISPIAVTGAAIVGLMAFVLWFQHRLARDHGPAGPGRRGDA